MLRTSTRVLPLRARRAKRRRRPRHDVPGAHMETVTQKGRFGKYGGRYVPETLIPALDELEQQYDRCRQDHLFQEELAYYLRRYCGRPTPLYLAERLTERLGGARDRKSTRLNSSHTVISYAVFCLKKKISIEKVYTVLPVSR